MKRRVTFTYVICLHIAFAVLLARPDVLLNAERRCGIIQDPELTGSYHGMVQYHLRSDALVPDGATIFIGDSIIQGLCTSSVTTPSVNYGIGRDTTYGVLCRLDKYASVSRAKMVVLSIGHNDMMRTNRTDDEMLANYRRIIESTPCPVVVSAILPVDEEMNEGYRKKHLNERIRHMNKSLLDLCSRYPSVRYIDTTPLLVDESGNLRDELADGDGAHLNAAGNRILAAEMRRVVN